MSQTPNPLPLPANFNPATLMISTETEYGLFHEVRRAAQLAVDLIVNGTPIDIGLAEQILERVLACQELDARDPHVGNFYWMAEDSVVEDLNAVEFVLERLIPLMLQHADRLSRPMQRRVLDAIRLGLAEIMRLDVLVAYSNITALDILNSSLGGELLGEASIARRGYEKLAAWIAFTNISGHPLEYNSPTYTAVSLRALHKLVRMTAHEETRIRARALAARLALSVGLHIHRGTGRWAGPHSRAYHPSIVGETRPEEEMVRGWIDDEVVPGWMVELLEYRPLQLSVVETADRLRDLAFTTYSTNAYALGVASRNFHGQSNVCMVHFRHDTSERPGVLYTRFLLNDKWFGDSYHATDRTRSRNLLDEGEFFGIQSENRALGVYSFTGAGPFHSAKGALIWTNVAAVDEIWIGEERIAELPALVAASETVVIGSGDAYMAVKPIHLSALGRETPVQLVERDGDLVLEMFVYRGVAKRFWELNWPGAFFQGRPICAYYLEVAARNEYVDGAALARAIGTGVVQQKWDDAYTYPAQGERGYRVSYERDGREIGLDIDVMTWRVRQRWTESGPMDFHMLKSPIACETHTSQVAVAESVLSCETPEQQNGSIWLCALPQAHCWVAGYMGSEPVTLQLKTPHKTLRVAQMGTGTLCWRTGEIVVDAVGDPLILS